MISQMLTYRRAHDSEGEGQFIARFIAPVTKPLCDPLTGAIHAYAVSIGQSKYAFCAHTDSVHNRMNPATRQSIGFDTARAEYFVNDPKQRDCLGADNAAGCHVLLSMIAANTPGFYIFFRGEERGGIGSQWVAENMPEIFNGIDAAIAFDRRDSASVITHMSIGRTCSDAFAESLCDLLEMAHAPDSTGSFTDTANLAHLIPECTNVSVGYDFEHSSREVLDSRYLDKLTARCIAAFKDAPALTIERQAGAFHDTGNARLADLSDAEIYELADTLDPETIARILIEARDEIKWGAWR